MQDPKESHWKLGRKVLKYISSTRDFGIKYEGSSPNLCGFSDSDFAGDIMDRKSISAYAIFIGGGAISWLSKKQATISLSSTETEYKALTTCTKEMLWIKRMLLDLHLLNPKKIPIIYCDNLSAQSLAT